jgi:hypothetical protein
MRLDAGKRTQSLVNVEMFVVVWQGGAEHAPVFRKDVFVVPGASVARARCRVRITSVGVRSMKKVKLNG